ncbi:MAG: ATPase domain-containing protein [Candidatus Aenigmatarchaeota archaeon]
MTIERIKSGIHGLDKLIEGGYPKGSVILVSGGPGTGKTIFALQYIYNGAKEGEAGLYITFEEDPKSLKESVKNLGMDFDELEDKKKAAIIKLDQVSDLPDFLKIVESNIKRLKAKRLVIDSLSSLEVLSSTFQSIARDVSPITLREGYKMMPEKEAIIRRFLYKIINYLKGLDVTTLLTSESQDTQYSRYGVAEFVVDGIIKLEYEIVGKIIQRNILVVKLRKSKIEGGRRSIEIGKGGIKVVD